MTCLNIWIKERKRIEDPPEYHPIFSLESSKIMYYKVCGETRNTVQIAHL